MGSRTEVEVARALDWLKDYNIQVILMNCVSKYPASFEDYKFEWMRKYRWVKLGLSDHIIGSGLIYKSITNYITYFEKHFRLPDTPSDNPDFGHSLLPNQFADYVAGVHKAAGDFYNINKQLAPGEEGEQVWMQRGSDGKRPRDA